MNGRSLSHWLRVSAGIGLPQTQTTLEERQGLAEFLSDRKTIADIGVFDGFTTQFVSEHANPGAVF